MAAAHHRDRRFGRTEHAHVVVFRHVRDQSAAVAFRAVAVVGGEDQAGEPAERRKSVRSRNSISPK